MKKPDLKNIQGGDSSFVSQYAMQLVLSLDDWTSEAADLLSNKDYWAIWRAIDVLQKVRSKLNPNQTPEEDPDFADASRWAN